MKRICILTCIIFSFILTGCMGSGPDKEEQKAGEKLQSSVTVQLPPRQSQENAEAVRERMAKYRAAKIEEIKEAFLGETGGKNDPNWRITLKGEKSGVCNLRGRYLQLAGAYNDVIYSDGEIGWHYVGIGMEKAKELKRSAGLIYAGELAKILSRPYAERLEIELSVNECGGGEAGLDLEDAGGILSEVEYVLVDVDANPSAIGGGVTTEKLHATLLADYVARIADMRGQILKNRTSESDGTAIIVKLAKDAIEDWRFTPDELKLTEYERNAIKLRN